MKISIPKGTLKSTKDSEIAAQRRKEIMEKLRSGQGLIIKPDGGIGDKTADNTTKIPKGKLASFYWYENEKMLFDAEQEIMAKKFPQFKLEKLSDNRMSWVGTLDNIADMKKDWTLQLVYDNNHPHNDSYGGSIKVYPIEPSLENITLAFNEDLPHVLTDSGGYMYLCTARKKDFQTGDTVTTAVSTIGWAIKWIIYFELWVEGDLNTKDFNAHNFL